MPDHSYRGRLFGEAADAYDTGRPGYPDRLVADVLAYAGREHPTAVEVGAGTGKATVPFAAAGVAVHCLEPDPRMAAVLRSNVAGYPAVQVEVTAFEDWRPYQVRFDLLLAATSWHWTDPARRWDLVIDALKPGGVVALCWNPLGVVDPDLHAELARVDRRYDIDDSSHAAAASSYGPRAGDWDTVGMWPASELAADGRFGDLREVRYREQISYGVADYVQLLDSTSTYRILPQAVREAALADTAAVLHRAGGITVLQATDLCLARVDGRH